MTPDDIAADRAVIDAATDAPWRSATLDVEDGYAERVGIYQGTTPVLLSTSGVALADAAFIAAARTGWPRALDALEAAQADRDEWRENAVTLRGLLDNQAHNFEAMNQALRDVTVERDEAWAEAERLRNQRDCAEEQAADFEAAIARVRARHRPGFPDRDGNAVCKTCFDDYPCATIRDLDVEEPGPENDGNYCCTPDSGDCCGPGSWCCSRAGKHDHPEEA